MVSSDHEIIQACLRQEQDGWKELISRYQRLIYSVARSFCPKSEDAADLFQNVCLELHKNLHRLRNEQTLSAWLITVTRRQALAVLRSRKPEIPIEDFEPAMDSQVESLKHDFEMERAIRQLPDRCERLLRLLYYDIDEPSYADIAHKMGIPVASIGPTRARCLEKLKRQIEV